MGTGLIDRTGQRFGRLSVLEYAGPNSGATWKCKCDCGTYTIVRADNLRTGKTTSCGCYMRESLATATAKMRGQPSAQRRDITGKRFGRLLATYRTGTFEVGKNKSRHSFWMFKCDCGTEKQLDLNSVTTGKVVSCGCYNRENTILRNQTLFAKHRMCATKVYRIWASAKERVRNPNTKHFPDYGGRGITMAIEWLSSFETFYKDMGDPPEGTSLDRIDVNGNYEPDNCRWATKSEQARNKRKLIRHRDKDILIEQWKECVSNSQHNHKVCEQAWERV